MSHQATASHAQRAAIQHAIAVEADELLHSDDTRPHLDDHERLALLTEAVGGTAGEITRNGSLDLDAALLRLAAETSLWLEARERERAAS